MAVDAVAYRRLNHSIPRGNAYWGYNNTKYICDLLPFQCYTINMIKQIFKMGHIFLI